jgi:hypothetical protein
MDTITMTQIASGNSTQQICLITAYVVYLCMIVLFNSMYYKKSQASIKFKKFNILCVTLISFVQTLAATLLAINIPNMSHLDVSDAFEGILLCCMFFGITWSIFDCISALLYNENNKKRRFVIQYAVIALISIAWYIGFSIWFSNIPIVL